MKTNRFLLVVLACALPLGALAAQSGRARRAAPPPPPPPAAKAPEPEPQEPPRHAPIPIVAKYDTKYAGGSLGFEHDAKVVLKIKDGVITLETKNTHVEVPAESVTSMSYGQSVRQRTAEAIGVGTVVPGLGGIINKSKSTAHYVELVWNIPPSGGAALRVDKDDYRGLIAALEGATGLQVRMEPAPPVDDFPNN